MVYDEPIIGCSRLRYWLTPALEQEGGHIGYDIRPRAYEKRILALAMKVVYRRTIPYPILRVLSQYFDLEHIAHVHPRSFGEARLVTCAENSIVWELVSPRYFGLRFRNLIVQEYIAPHQIRARVIKGIFRGTEVSTRLEQSEKGTLVDETYLIPLAAWPWLGALVRALLLKRLDRIWEEDLKVGLCHGGWPSVPRGNPRSPKAFLLTFPSQHIPDKSAASVLSKPSLTVHWREFKRLLLCWRRFDHLNVKGPSGSVNRIA